MKTNQVVISRESRVASNACAHVYKTRNSRPATRTSQPRRGILLLVVLSMLTLFLLIGTAFIVTANQYKQANKTLAKVTATSNSSIDQGNLLNEVINQIVRDTNNQNSSLRFHSLLRDMYGNDGFTATVASAKWADIVGRTSNPTGGQFLELTLSSVTDQFGNQLTLNDLSTVNNAYNGLVLSFIDGPVRGQSVRIVGYLAANTGTPAVPVPTFRVMSPRKADGSSITPADFSQLAGNRIVLNGRPFNGTGAGFNPTASSGARLNALETVNGVNREIALMPNAAFFDPLDTSAVLPTPLAPNLGYYGSIVPVPAARFFPGLGGSDESYDAADYQNMILGLMQNNPVETVLPDITVPGYPSDLGRMVLPSNHRPALLRYWREQLVGATELQDNPAMLRKVLLRPNWIDHPLFTGSNPEIASIPAADREDKLRRMIYGPWDVDNDNDGVRDSVWVDVGLPVMEDSDGRLVKPLAAILVLDMDGRLNLNAHGSMDIANAPNFNLSVAGTAGNPVSTDQLPQGIGYGPAEISLEPLMPGASKADRWDWYKRYLWGASTSDRLLPSDLGSRQFNRQMVGKQGLDSVPGRTGNDIASDLKMQGMPRWPKGFVADPSGRPSILGGYATPPDPRGRYALGLNQLGQPVYEAFVDATNASTWMNSDTPYDTDLSLNAIRGENASAEDSPFSVAELERVLRAYDPDANALPSRIWELAGEFKNNASNTTPNLDRLNTWRTTLTTDSYDLPVPSVIVPEWMVNGVPGVANSSFTDVMNGRQPVSVSFVDLLEYRIRIAQSPIWLKSSDTAARLLFLQNEIRKLLPPDLADGLRLDINRPLGNGRDDNGNGVTDEPGEDEGPFWTSADQQLQNTGFTNINGLYADDSLFLRLINRDNDPLNDSRELDDFKDLLGITGTIDTIEERIIVHNLRRQTLARDLYVLAMTLVDPLPVPAEGPNDPGYVERNAQRAKKLAQWAINVVDFRDPDNIMTAFEYDANPFDGWTPDGSLLTQDDVYGTDNKPEGILDQGGVVWGAENPELIMTETLAWHDRRTIDTRREGEPSLEEADSHEKADVGPRQKQNGEPYDASQDQRERPQGAAFVELYCPLAPNPAANKDTHFIDNAGNDLGINIAKTHDLTATGSPVWRMIVYKNGGPGKVPEDPNPDNRPTDLRGKNRADRCVYFTGFDPGHDDDGVAFFNEVNNVVPPVRPGRYMVVGAGERRGNGEYLAKFGENNAMSSPRGVLLKTGNVTDAVTLLNASGRPADDVGGFTVVSPPDPDDPSLSLSSVAIINRTAASAAEPQNFTLSEPASGYPRSVEVESDKPFSNSAWDEIKKEYVPILDIPLDEQRAIANPGGNAADPVRQRNRAFRDGENRLALPQDDRGDRTIPNFSWLYLQRLANPLLPWNPPARLEDGTINPRHNASIAVNPYMTVDSIGANVTVFNGLSDAEFAVKGGSHKRFSNNNAKESFASLQRGRYNSVEEPYTNNIAIYQERVQSGKLRINLNDSTTTPMPLVTNLYGTERIEQKTYWKNSSGPTGEGYEDRKTSHYFEALPDCTLGFLNEPLRVNTRSKIAPPTPFPWLTWNNRPFANAGELLNIPAFSGLDLLHTFSYSNTTNTNLEHYGLNQSNTSKIDPVEDLLEELKQIDTKITNTLEVDGRFGHLLNFFRSEQYDPNNDSVETNPATLTDDKGLAGLYRLLDYIQVPSPFVNTETWLNPDNFGNSPVILEDDPRNQRQPPFNRIPEYREPGRINLNTIVSADAWDGGVLHRERQIPANPWDPITNPYLPNTGHTGSQFFDVNSENGFTETRRGYSGSTTSTIPGTLAPDDQMLLLNPGSPTFFANPFRSADAGDLLPVGTAQEGINCTMLRGVEASGNAIAGTLKPLFASERTNAYNNANRNSYYRYQAISRLSSMTTTRSNVYAVWVTIGFFEVDEAPALSQFASINGLDENDATTEQLYRRVYPEGYQFTQEAGSETGNIRRVRGFAIVDRTIPVAFEPGQNHNVDKAIRLRRRLE